MIQRFPAEIHHLSPIPFLVEVVETLQMDDKEDCLALLQNVIGVPKIVKWEHS